MILVEAYRILRAAGCCGNQREFSTDWLRKGPSYFSSMVAPGRTRTPGIVTLLTLYEAVRLRIDDASVQGSTLPDLADTIWSTVMARIPRDP